MVQLVKSIILTREHIKGAGIKELVAQSTILVQWPTEILNQNPKDWMIRNYKADSWISDDLWTDEWVYIVKSGFCVVAKVKLYTISQQL